MEKIMYYKAEDGMLYPNLRMPEEKVSMTKLGRFGKLAEKMQEVETQAYQMMEELENSYLKAHLPKNPQSTMELWQLREQARMQAEEIVMNEVVLRFH